jgi:thiamine-phosphate diphosphorylase / hydroxyethylthiazole kinase
VSSTGHALDGLAVVSDIVASPNPEKIAQTFRSILADFRTTFISPSKGLSIISEPDSIIHTVGALLQHVKALNPVVHQVLAPSDNH